MKLKRVELNKFYLSFTKFLFNSTLIIMNVLNIVKFKKNSNHKSVIVKSSTIRSALVRVINDLDTTNGKSKVVKIGDKYFRIRELG